MLRRHFYLFLAVLLVEVVVIFAFISPDTVKRNYVNEREIIDQMLGSSIPERSERFANYMWERTTGKLTKPVEEGIGFFGDSESEAMAKIDVALDKGIKVIVEHLSSILFMSYIAYFRIAVFGQMLAYFLPVLVAVAVDGAVVRLVARQNEEEVSTFFYHSAKNTFIFLTLFPLVALVLPFSASPIVYIIWFIVYPWVGWVGVQNVHKY